jgi:hypothetical protein
MALDPPPTISPITMQQGSTLSSDWTRWMLALWGTVSAQPIVIGTRLNLTKQNAAIPQTAFPSPALRGGLYRITWYVRITTPDPVSSSVALTIGFSDSGLALTIPIPALTGNTVLSVLSGTTIVFSDQATAMTYATTYASNTPGTMKYRLAAAVEQV